MKAYRLMLLIVLVLMLPRSLYAERISMTSVFKFNPKENEAVKEQPAPLDPTPKAVMQSVRLQRDLEKLFKNQKKDYFDLDLRVAVLLKYRIVIFSRSNSNLILGLSSKKLISYDYMPHRWR